ncbi:MAG: WD40 repeat domain-containing protein [Planctomycetes bacterium]|nr:WD40 repeat domain-containing protein [Planctomycetota bacterium]
MAHIVCQVVRRPERITFLWSQAEAAFEPYHLSGEELEALLHAVKDARRLLAEATRRPSPQVEAELARAGHQLYRALLPERVVHIRQWLRDQHNQNPEIGLEILSDMPGAIPWNVVNDQSREPANILDRTPESAFWGFRMQLGAGRRVNPLRVNSMLEAPTLLTAIDPGLKDSLSIEQRNALADFGHVHQATICESVDDLSAALRVRAPDVLFVLARVTEGRLRFGSRAISVEALRELLADANEGNPDPVVVLCAVGEENQNDSMEGFLESAVNSLAGLIACETAVPVDLANSFGLDVVSLLLAGGKSLGRILSETRVKHGLAGLAFSGFCPGFVRVAGAGEKIVPEVSPRLYALPEAPYRPFAACEREDRPLLVGRADDIVRCASNFDETATRGLLLHGHGGVGKSSFLRAGLIPHLEDEAVGYLALRDRTPSEAPVEESAFPVVAIRPGPDLAGQLVDALCVFCAQPFTFRTPTGETVTVELPALLAGAVRGGTTGPSERSDAAVTPQEVWQALQEDPDQLARLLESVTGPLPFELVILIEQGDDLFTAVQDRWAAKRRRQALAMLQRLFQSRARCKVVLSLRTEFVGRLMDSAPAGNPPWRNFHLRELKREELIEVLLTPTSPSPIPYGDQIPFEKYLIVYEAGLAQSIVDDIWQKARPQGVSALSLTQATGALLYESAKKRGLTEIRLLDRKELGEVDKVMSRLVDQKIGALPMSRSAQNGVRLLLDDLHSDKSMSAVSRRLATWREVQQQWQHAEPLDRVIDAAAGEGLLEVNRFLVNGKESLFLGLPQEGLAQVGVQRDEERRLRTFGRTKIIDTLWIMIPLLLLGMAITWSWTRSSSASSVAGGMSDDEKKAVNRLVEEIKSSQWPVYAGFIARAQIALEAGNALQVRQNLLAQIPFRLESDPLGPEKDLRSFEWYYLWRQINREQGTIAGQRATVTCLAVSPEGNVLASGGVDGVVKLWDLNSGLLRADLVGHKGPVQAVAFSPSGKLVATAAADQSVRLWGAHSGKDGFVIIDREVRQLQGKGSSVLCLAFGKDEGALVGGSEEGKVILWNAVAGKEETTYSNHQAPVRALVFSSDGKTLASGGDDERIVLRLMADSKIAQTIKTPGAVQTLAFGPENKTLAAGINERQNNLEIGAIRLWDSESGKEIGKPLQHSSGIFALSFLPVNNLLISTGKDNLVRCWDHAAGVQVGAVPGHLGWVGALVATPDGKRIVTGSYDAAIKIWDAKSLVRPNVLPSGQQIVQAVAFSRDDKVLATGDNRGGVKLWDLKTGGLQGALPEQAGSIAALAFFASAEDNPRKLAVAVYGNDGEIKLWELTAGKKDGFEPKPVLPLKGHAGGVACLAVSPNGKELASGGTDGAVIVWNLDEGQAKRTFKGHKGAVQCIAFVPDTPLVASGGADGSVRFWDATTGKEGRQAQSNVHPGGVTALAFFPENPFYATSGRDLTTKTWKIDAKEPSLLLRVFRSHGQPVSAIGASAKLGYFASGSLDGTLRIFDLQRERLTLMGHAGAVRALAISHDGLTIASGGHDGGHDEAVHLWRALAPAAVNPDR